MAFVFRKAPVLGLVAAFLLGACSDDAVVGEYPNRRHGDTTPYDYQKNPNDSVFGPGGLTFGGDQKRGDGEATGMAVNGYLWRASLDTVSFMPVNSADPFGGVIITDWHSLAETPNERFKMNVYILSRSLRSDGVRVALFRQIRDTDGSWQDATVADQATGRIEDAILTRARQLRFASLQQ